ncbi:Dipeptide-binding protein [Serratia odorifera]|uniref:Dipeptide-binding protein n=1 Tax=Serratia odorifera TaxID=618 RepID=A0A3S4DP88_SEROD|nr:Dipeptide-binding protein [Serratia odorifera]
MNTINYAALATGIMLSLTTLGTVQAAVPKDMLAIGKAADPQTLDPAVTIDNNDWTVTYPAYQRLVQYKTENGKGSTQVEGELAASWSASDDRREWTFKLKPGNRFDDGSEVTADAVKWSFERLMSIGQGPSEAFPKDMQVTAVDPLTVKFTLKTPFAPFLYTLANDGAGIVNPAIAQGQPGRSRQGLVGKPYRRFRRISPRSLAERSATDPGAEPALRRPETGL